MQIPRHRFAIRQLHSQWLRSQQLPARVEVGFDDTDRLQEEVDRAHQKEAEKWQHKLLVVATVYEVSFFKCQVYSHTYVRCAAWGVIQKGEFFKEVWNRWKDAVCFKY